MAYWNNGAALNDTELANARQWAQGKTWGEIQSMGQQLGGTADQLGQIFNATGQQVNGYGYGLGQTPYDAWKYNSGAWARPAETTAPLTQTPAPAPMTITAPQTPQTAQYQGPSSVGQSWQQQNPYLDSMAAGITNQFNKNLSENILPQVRYGAQAAGGFGGSRQGIAEGQAISGSNEGLAAALANMYSTSFENSLNRDLQKYGIDVNSATARYGTDKSYDLGMRNADNQLLGIQSQYDLGLRGDATDRIGLAQNYDLGLRGDATQRFGINTNAATQMYGTDKSYDLGLRNAGNQATQIANAYDLGLRGDATQRYGVDTNAATSKYVSDNSLQGQLAGAAASQANAAANLSLGQQRLGWDQFQYQDQADWRELNNLAGLYKTFSGLGGTETSTGQNSAIANGIGGALTFAQFMKMMGY